MKWVSYFSLFWCCPSFLAPADDLGGELLGEALLLRPLVVVGGSVLLEDLGVLGDEVLAAEGADGHGLSGLDGSAVLVHLDASAGGVGLLVLALDTVLLGDRHGERWWLCVGEVVVFVLCLLSYVRCERRKLGDLELEFLDSEDPLFYKSKMKISDHGQIFQHGGTRLPNPEIIEALV